MTIDAHEVDGARSDDRVLRFSFRKPNRAKMEVVRGRGAGIRVIWNGGATVHIRGGLLSLLPVTLDLQDPRVTSLRGNTMLHAEFEPVLDCFLNHRNAVTERPGPRIDGRSTVLITLERLGGIDCPGDVSRDRAVTKDVLTVVRASATVVRRERYVDSAVVERWSLRDLALNAGLTEKDFH